MFSLHIFCPVFEAGQFFFPSLWPPQMFKISFSGRRLTSLITAGSNLIIKC